MQESALVSVPVLIALESLSMPLIIEPGSLILAAIFVFHDSEPASLTFLAEGADVEG